MERVLIVLVATLMVFVGKGVQGSGHLSFNNSASLNITRVGCGTQKLCVETPNDCDPAGNDTCLFASVVAASPMAPSGTLMSFELRGESTGYIALGLTTNASVGTTLLFICAQNSSNNGSFFFRTRDLNNTNNELTANERRTQQIRGNVSEDVIRCGFDVPMLNASMSRAMMDTTFIILLGNGTYNSSGFGSFNILLNTGALNLSNPTGAVTSASSSAVHPQAMLVLLSILFVFPMLRA